MIGLLASVGCVRGGASAPGGTNPYDWAIAPTGAIAGRALYPAFDLNLIDWQQTNPLQKPYPPVTTTTHDVATQAAFNSTVANGRYMRLTANVTGNLEINADDVIIDLNGFTVTGTIQFFGGSRFLVMDGLIIGSIQQSIFEACTDIVCDNVQLKTGSFVSGNGFLTSRVALINSALFGDVGYYHEDLVLAGTNFYSNTGWCVREGGSTGFNRLAMFGVQSLNTTNSNVRLHGVPAPEVVGPFWIGYSGIGNAVEGSCLRVDTLNGLQDTPVPQGYVRQSLLYSSVSGIEAYPNPGWCTEFVMDSCTISDTSATFTPPQPETPSTVVASSSGGLLLTYGQDWPNWSVVRFTTTGTLPTGLSPNTDYWLIRVDATTARVATSLANAGAITDSTPVPIPFTDAGTGTHTMTSTNLFTNITLQDSDLVPFPPWGTYSDNATDPSLL